ncbi:unnamed protein product [Medioppia subpectinata]|uniref:Uncharacterized protein n=1 Tax=Medioppia subpectinata TaxID=1979941 RepID=A0A7R9KU31_9ACAR|nr:unnamed protein product [Medioppia subpectinata]CAG2109898.1 unnamed protein product [Medioppia subpectinata]
MSITTQVMILLSITCGIALGMPTGQPQTFVMNTPYGPQVFRQQTASDGSQFWQSVGPGYSHTSFVSGGNPNNGFHFDSMSTGSANAFGNGFNMGSMGGMGSGMSMGSFMGNGGGMTGMAMGSGMWPMMQPMQPMQPFKWWPSIFSNN